MPPAVDRVVTVNLPDAVNTDKKTSVTSRLSPALVFTFTCAPTYNGSFEFPRCDLAFFTGRGNRKEGDGSRWRLKDDMKFSRRNWLGSSAILLGSGILDALTTPLWRWTGTPVLQAATVPHPEAPSPVTFVDVAKEAGLNVPNVWGGVKHKKYIIEAKGSGLAFFDYDQDGWLDIYLTNGDRLPGEEPYPDGKTPTQHLFKNNRDGTFTDVTEKSGLARTGWGTGVCVGDYDNDGWDDLFCCYWGHNVLWHNNGDGTFTDVTKKAGLWEDRVRWGSGCTWLDYDRDGFLDLFVCNYIELDLQQSAGAGADRLLPMERHSGDVRPARPAGRNEYSLP